MIDQYLNKITTGDCLVLLKEIPDNSVDMTFADPPFNLKKNYKNYHDSLEVEKYLEWCDEWITEMVRITKPSGSIFIHNIPKWLTYYCQILNQKAHFKHWISWYAPTAPMGKSLQPAHYGTLFYVKDPKDAKIYPIRMPHERERKSTYLKKDYGGKKDQIHPFGPLVSDVWNDIHRVKHGKYRDDHPCQLPVALLERMILLTTDEGDTVLDPFMGSGTTAVAAKKLGRNYVGFDLSEDYKKIGENNLSKVESNSKVGDSWISYHLGEVRTLRDKDWDNLKDHFEIPVNMKDIDFTKISLKGDMRKFNTPQKEKVGLLEKFM